MPGRARPSPARRSFEKSWASGLKEALERRDEDIAALPDAQLLLRVGDLLHILGRFLLEIGEAAIAAELHQLAFVDKRIRFAVERLIGDRTAFERVRLGVGYLGIGRAAGREEQGGAERKDQSGGLESLHGGGCSRFGRFEQAELAAEKHLNHPNRRVTKAPRMAVLNDYPFHRSIRPPITEEQLRPLDPLCMRVQFESPLTDSDHVKLAKFLADYPKMPLRAYGHYSLPNLYFLRHYPFISEFQVDNFLLKSAQGTEYLPETLEYFGLGQTKTKNISLGFLKRFSHLKDLYLEGHTKHIETISNLLHLERLVLKSVTLPDLELLLPLKQLWALDISLGGTKNLSLLPQIGGLKYLELWMIKGLHDLSMVGEITSLQNLFLQALKNVTVLPSFSNLRQLRRVTLHTMKGLTDLSAVAAAPALEELIVVAAPQLSPDDFKPFIGHPTLKKICIGLGSQRKNEQVQALLGLPACEGYKTEFSYR